MLCNDNESQKTTECTNSCDRCMSGMMILIGIISGIVFAAVGAALFINSLLSAPLTAALTALITGIVFLFTVVIASAGTACSKLKKCICCHSGGLFFGIFGTIFSSLTAAAVTLTVGSVLSAVIVGLVFFFFAYMIVSMLFLSICTCKAG